MRYRILFTLIALLCLTTVVTAQEATPEPAAPVCPALPLAGGPNPDTPGGLILTAFDGSALWVYDVARGGRYPLSDTRPCAGACRLSPDGLVLLYLYDGTNAYNRMRLDGAVRDMVVAYAGQVEWWGPDTFLVYTPGHTVYLLNSATDEREDLPSTGVVSVQPGGRFALVVTESGGQIVRALRDLTAPPNSPLGDLPLAPDRLYYDASAWSPDGAWLAFVAPVGASSSELFGIQPGMLAPEQWTNLTPGSGPVRINGQAVGELSWSPDGARLAFWVTPLNGDAPDAPTTPAVIHILDRESGTVIPMCGYATLQHTPNPPRLVWSPDGSFLAFADDVPGAAKGTLITLNTATGEYRALTSGVAAVAGPPNLIAWGLKP
ncbi:MAG TPA: hypothetical protein VER79_06180 [Candidatus Limnocylindrales bacterium]|nr:hypothetical protein [Candidatus Limnocylindrales bacterium]